MSEKLYETLCEHLTPHKRDLFDRMAANRTRHLAMVAEDIYQTQNSSAILRSAECWGVQDIYVIENSHSFQVHHRIAKGAEDWLTLHRFHSEKNNTNTCMQELKRKGYRIVVTSVAPDAVAPDELDVSTPLAIVMGTELTGVSEEAIAWCDEKVHIPMYGFTESLNVSVASAILMQTLISRIRREAPQWTLSEEEQLEIKTQWARRSIYWSDHIVQMYEQGELTRNISGDDKQRK
jgi:tRNA (guanosine-2'-O-)-methyltransferase